MHRVTPDRSEERGSRPAARLARYFLRYRGRIVVGSVALVAGTLLQLAFPYYTSALVDASWSGSSTAGEIDRISVVLGVIIVVILVCVYLDTLYFGETAERGIAALRRDVYARLVSAPMAFFARSRVGELTSRVLADVGAAQEFWSHDLRMLLRYGLLSAGAAVLMFVTAPRLGVLLLAVVPLIALSGWFFGGRIRRLAARTQEELAASSVVFEESLHGVQTVKAFGREEFELGRFGDRVARTAEVSISAVRLRGLFMSAILTVLFGAWVLVMWSGSRQVEAGSLTPGELTAFMFYVFFAGSSIGTLADGFGRMQKALGAAERICAILDEPSEEPSEEPGGIGAPGSADTVAGAGPRFRGEIGFDRVGFRYPNAPESPVLGDLSFRIAPGQRVALVGPSGAGKSTIVALLLRLFEPDEGEIRIDGRPLGGIPRRLLRSEIALVPQDVVLFGGTIEENIRYGREGATSDEIRAAADSARIHEFIESLPDGYQTRLGDRGARLSGGQKQRLAIARAVVRNPSILVLDEATSALDSENERLVQEALDDLAAGRTTIVIAHRLSTVRKADRILVLQGGRVVEDGRHDELFAAGGLYRLLCEQQAFGAESDGVPAGGASASAS